jgi:hypothetical protein
MCHGLVTTAKITRGERVNARIGMSLGAWVYNLKNIHREALPATVLLNLQGGVVVPKDQLILTAGREVHGLKEIAAVFSDGKQTLRAVLGANLLMDNCKAPYIVCTIGGGGVGGRMHSVFGFHSQSPILDPTKSVASTQQQWGRNSRTLCQWNHLLSILAIFYNDSRCRSTVRYQTLLFCRGERVSA